MFFDNLRVNHFRNINDLAIHLGPNLNWFFGANGCGKTSILESVYHFGYGRSFRTNSARKLISFDRDEFVLYSKLLDDSGSDHVLGVSKTKSGVSVLKVDGEQVPRYSFLVRFCPILFLGPDSAVQVFGTPAARRQLLDWVLFHVEHSYGTLTSKYRKVLKNRNALLRQLKRSNDIRRDEIEFWDEQVVALSEEMHEKRFYISHEFFRSLKSSLAELGLDSDGLEFFYEKGWRDDEELSGVLSESLGRDISFGATNYGAHRCDLRFKQDGKDIIDFWSRGMLRLMSVALLHATAKVLFDATGNKSVFLIDDFTSELDESNQERILNMLIEFGGQVLITQIDPNEGAFLSFSPSTSNQKKGKMFHVKQGRITEETT